MKQVRMRVICSDGSGGPWIESYDVDDFGGLGSAKLTDDPEKAMVWPSIVEALQARQEQSKLLPLRPDGKPNRPLSAFSLLVEPVD